MTTYYRPLPTCVERVVITSEACTYNLRPGLRNADYVEVRDLDTGDAGFARRDSLYTDPIAASIRSAELLAEALRD
jgi:hypothetical protein